MKKIKIFIFLLVLLILAGTIAIFSSENLSRKIIGYLSGKDLSRPDNPLFDISIQLEKPEVNSGEEQIVTTTIINTGLKQAEDVVVSHTLWNKNKEIKISEYKETIAVQTTISLARKIYVPVGLPSGKYMIEVEVDYKGNKTAASSNFIVRGYSFLEERLLEYSILALSAVLIIITALLFYLIRRIMKGKKGRKRAESR